MRTFNVFVSHDPEEELWIVYSSGIPGLTVEAGSYEALVAIVLDAAPDLIEALLGSELKGSSIPLAIQQLATAKRVHHADGLEPVPRGQAAAPGCALLPPFGKEMAIMGFGKARSPTGVSPFRPNCRSRTPRTAPSRTRASRRPSN